MPAEMPDRALRPGRRRRRDLVEQHQYVVRRFERRDPAPAALLRARELPCVKTDRGLGIDRVQVEMVEAWGRQHASFSCAEIRPTMRAAPPKSTPGNAARTTRVVPSPRRHEGHEEACRPGEGRDPSPNDLRGGLMEP